MLDSILANWKLVVIGALAVVVVFLVLKNTRLSTKVKELEAKALSLEAGHPAPPKAVQPPKAVPKPVAPPAPRPVPAVPMPPKAVPESDSSTPSDDEGFDAHDEYVAIEKYGNDEKELIIPININSLLQRAIERQIIPPNPKVESIASASAPASADEPVPDEVHVPVVDSFFLPDAEEAPVKADPEVPDSEEELRKKNIVALKELAKELGIKVNDGRKPKNKETLIAEILAKRQNI